MGSHRTFHLLLGFFLFIDQTLGLLTFAIMSPPAIITTEEKSLSLFSLSLIYIATSPPHGESNHKQHNPTIFIYRSSYPSFSLNFPSFLFHHHHLLYDIVLIHLIIFTTPSNIKEIIKGCVTTWLGARLIPSLLLIQREGIDQNNLKFEFTGFPGIYMFHLLLFKSCVYACIYV